MELAIMDLISVLGVIAGSVSLGFLKKHTGALDGAIGGAIKPLQPAIVALAGIGLPYLTSALEIAPVDPAVFVTAPTATIAAVSVREITKRLTNRSAGVKAATLR